MKKIYSIVTGILLTASVLAQAPQKMSYQAVIRNSSNALVTSKVVGMRISILKGSATATASSLTDYVETQTATTNANGLVSLEIGTGTAVTGTFATINWANGPYFIKTETDPTGGTNYTIVGTSELLSVPYALHAKTVENLSGINTGDQDLSGLATTSSVTSSLATKVDKETGKGLQADGSTAGQMQYWNGSAWVFIPPASSNLRVLYFINNVPQWGPIISPTDVISSTGKIWMDRNLGATQVATSSTDAASFGDLYQWGRGADGHQLRTSTTTATLSSTDVPGNANFIITSSGNYDWRSTQNDNLWQGVNGVNNPCPSGYRIPTLTELDAERASWSANNSTGAFASPLKLPLAGYRSRSDGSLVDVSEGYYWSSSINGTHSRYLYFYNGDAGELYDLRAYGNSVRCIKD